MKSSVCVLACVMALVLLAPAVRAKEEPAGTVNIVLVGATGNLVSRQRASSGSHAFRVARSVFVCVFVCRRRGGGCHCQRLARWLET